MVETYYNKFITIGVDNLINSENLFYKIFISSIPLVKPKRLKKKEKENFSLTDELIEILVGLLLGDIYGRYRYGKTSFIFKQGLIHQDYIHHLYELFNNYCPSKPKIVKGLIDTRTGKKYSYIYFGTYTLPCFNELYNLFYLNGKKIIPSNIGSLLTSVSLAYWIVDDGSWNKIGRYVSLSTDSFKLEEVEFLIEVLNSKFKLNCYKCKNGNGYKIIIPSYSIAILQNLISEHIPSMMRYKIGL